MTPVRVYSRVHFLGAIMICVCLSVRAHTCPPPSSPAWQLKPRVTALNRFGNLLSNCLPNRLYPAPCVQRMPCPTNTSLRTVFSGT